MLNRKQLTRILSCILLMLVFYFLFYIPQQEWQFLKSVENAFSKSGAEFIKVDEVTDFDWDVVCYIPGHTTKSFNLAEPEYKPILEPHLPTYPKFLTYGSYFFIKNNVVEKKISFSTWGFRFFQGSIYPLGLMIIVKDQPFLFMGEHNSENDGCIVKQDAGFKKMFYPLHNEKRILITNLKKETPK